MKFLAFLLPIFVLTGISMGAGAEAQTYQPSNRIPVADNTLGTQVLGNNNNFAITGGVSRGPNTFHSFQDFSVPTSGTTVFANPAGNQSIITRVTGSLFSDINGTINTQGANFLLINPNGVVFGPGTQLNVGRVFAASTADGIDLADGAGRTLTFGVNGSGDGALLSIDPKVTFNVSRLNLGGGNGEIKNFGTLQTNNSNQYIGLVGGNVTLDAGKINTPGGRVELGGLSAPGSVEVLTDGDSLRLGFPAGVDRSNLALNNQARISVASAGGGDIAINTHNVELLGNSVIRGGIEENMGTKNSTAGDINLKATGGVVIDNSGIANNVRTNAQGRAGNINIAANTLTLRKQGDIQSLVIGQGGAGNVQLKVAGAIDIADKSRIDSSINTTGVGNAGDILIDTESLTLHGGAVITSLIAGQGNSGNISANAKGVIVLDGAAITTNAEGLQGNAGNIKLSANSLSLLNDATISATSFGRGSAGNISLAARKSVALADPGTSISSSIEANGVGRAGDISINTESLSLNNGAQLLSAVVGKGDGGNISIFAKDAVFAGKNTAIFTTTESGNIGNSGSVDITVDSLSINNGAQILASNSGEGSSGNIKVQANGKVDISGKSDGISSGIRNNLEQTGIGNAGSINISSKFLSITEGSGILATSSGKGDSGSINIKTSESVFLSGTGSQIASTINPGARGNANNINIEAGSVSVQDGSFIITSSSGNGNAGNITVVTKDAINLSGETSSLISSVVSGAIGTGGDINLQGSSLSLTDGSLLLAFNNGIGDSGNVKVKVSGAVDIVGVPKSARGGIGNFVKTQGNGGDIIIEANSLSLQNGAAFLASNSGQGNSGIINVKATDSIFFSGVKGNFSQGLFVTAVGEKSVAGNIVVAAPRITLDNEFSINAESISGNGGNIFIGGLPIAGSTDSQNNIGTATTNLFFLRNGSKILTNASGVNQPNSTGGNISLNSNFIIAVPKENSDITANAISGRGGNVSVTTQGLFGTQSRPRQTSNSDITASSDFGQNGSISINTPGIDPGKDTSKLPTRPIDASRQISQKCSSTQEDNQFYVTGRGGHAPNASELLSNSVVWLDPRNQKNHSIAKNPSTQIFQKSPQPAVGWSFNRNGKVTLLAASDDGTVNQSSSTCPNTIIRQTR